MIFQVLKDEFDSYTLDQWKKRFDKIYIIEDWKLVSREFPVICSANLKNQNVRYWLTKKFPALYIARGYLGNHLYKNRKWWRISVNGWANLKIRKIPSPRWNNLNLPLHPWKVKEIKNVLITPSKMTTYIWKEHPGNVSWHDFIRQQLPTHLNVRIRLKGKTTPRQRWNTLWDDLDWADLIVGQSSAITCEAFWYGKQVISTKPCNTWASQINTLKDWHNATEPVNRSLWHEHLAWSQFTSDEIRSGEAIENIIRYAGDPISTKHIYDYKF